MCPNSARQANVLVMQSGGPTPVVNRSLVGLVGEVTDRGEFGQIFGAVHGLEGVLAERFVDLDRVSKAEWRRIAGTPGAALGSSRRKLKFEDAPALLDVLRRHGIRFWFIIGGNDSAETAHSVSLAKSAEQELSVMLVPKTIDNDLTETDHSPGYGSAARFVALAAMGAGRDAEAMGAEAPVTVLEVMGRDAGWLAASAALARRDERDAPHVICVPELPVDEDRFVGQMQEAYRRFGFAVAVVAENVRGEAGVLGGQAHPERVDEFGHAYFDGAGHHLAQLVGSRLGVRARYEKPGTVQRSMISCVSTTDAEEAELLGSAAVRYALEGSTGHMVTLVREPGESYGCTTGLAPLEEVAGQVRKMPEEYLDRDSSFVTEAFLRYARPLIGALPRFGRIR